IQQVDGRNVILLLRVVEGHRHRPVGPRTSDLAAFCFRTPIGQFLNLAVYRGIQVSALGGKVVLLIAVVAEDLVRDQMTALEFVFRNRGRAREKLLERAERTVGGLYPIARARTSFALPVEGGLYLLSTLALVFESRDHVLVARGILRNDPG